MEIIINKENSGKTVKELLTEVLKLPHSTITFLKSRESGITLNGERVTVRKTVKEGDIFALEYSDEKTISELSDIKPVKLPLDIIYQDSDIIALCKPPFMPTHPSCNHQNDTLANALRYYFDSLDIPFIFRAVNRLDNRTSGIVLVAKNRLAAGKLSCDIANKGMSKSYLAVVHGVLKEEKGEICFPIKREADSIIKRTVAEDGAYSLTKYRTIFKNEMYSLLEVVPITGRTHQIRVHLSHIGNPICGDTMYGYPSEFINRQALHAYKLIFNHPTKNQRMTLSAMPSDDITELCKIIFGLDRSQIERLLNI